VLALVLVIVALLLGSTILGIVGYTLYGHGTRLATTVAAARDDLLPAVTALQDKLPQRPAGAAERPGRHRAG
jgi:hypothetical protein